MMTIKEIYKRYQIPPNLQRHMREVAQVTWFVADNWIGETLNLDLALNTALLHDLGNLVKFKQPFLGELKSRADHWLAFQSEMITKYGGDAKIATLAMVAELGLAESVGRILAEMDDLLVGNFAVSDEAKLVEFADLCVSPEGIVGFEQRKQDLIGRYGETHGLDWIEPAEQLLTEIQNKTGVDISGELGEATSIYRSLVAEFSTKAITA